MLISLSWLSVCLFISNKRQNGLNRSGSHFVWDLTLPQGRIMNDQYLKIRV